jgi:hypothetical protein
VLVEICRLPSPQRKTSLIAFRDWWFDEVEEDMMRDGKALGKLSAELRKCIREDVDEFPISLEEAKEARLRLMEERKAYVTTHTSTAFEGNKFSLCEH